MYEIREARTLELIETDLTFEDATELLYFYQDMCGYDVVMVSARNTFAKPNHYNHVYQYKSDYIHYFAQLQEMGNLI